MLQVYRLFDPSRSFRHICNQWAKLVTTTEYLADPDQARALTMLTPEKFEKMIAYLNSPLGQRVRTNNHVERTNRRLRYLEKVRYKWRRRRTIVRFVVLAFDRWRQRQAKAALGNRQTLKDPSNNCLPNINHNNCLTNINQERVESVAFRKAPLEVRVTQKQAKLNQAAHNG